MRYVLMAAVILSSWLPTARLGAAEPDDALAAARVHWQKGRYGEAIEAYEELLKKEVSDARIPIGLSRCYRAEGDWKQATEILQTATKDFAEDPQVWAALAQMNFLQGKYPQAEAAVKKSLELNVDQPLARLVQADLFTETGQLEKADEGYRWFVQYYNRVQPEDAETLMLVARGAAQYARWNSVSQIFNFVVNTLCPDALTNDENYWQSYYVSGSLLLEKYNRGQAVPEFRSALAINARSAEIFAEMARAAAQDHELDEAKEFAQRALEIQPNNIVARQVLSDIQFFAGDIQDALATLEKAAETNPRDQGILGRIAACYLLIDGMLPEEEFTETLSFLEVDKPEELKVEGRFAKLIVDLARVNPRPGQFLTVLGGQLETRRKFDQAESCYQYAIARMPQLSEPQTALGMLYMQIGRVEEAGEILDKAFDLDPYHVRVSNMRKVIKVLDGYDTITTDHFVIRIDSELDKVLGRYMAEYLEEEYDKLVKQFGFEPPARTHFEVYNKAKGLTAHQWFSARMVGLPWIQTIGASTGLIVAMASPTAKDQQFNWARVLRHEFVHVITLQQTNFNIPHWFTEALAVRNEGYPRSQSWNEMLARRVPKREMMNLGNINETFVKPDTPEDWQMAYCQSELYAEYMVKLRGEDSLGKMLDAYRDELTTAQAIEKVFGVKQQAFEEGYLEYVDGIVAALNLKNAEAKEERSLADLEKAFRDNPESATARAEYAAGLLEAGQDKQARKYAKAAQKSDPQEPTAALVIAQLDVKAEDLEQAIAELEKVLDEKKPHAGLIGLLGQLYLKTEKYAEAARVFEIMQKAEPENLDWIKALTAAYLKLNDNKKLAPLLKQYVELEFDEPAPRKKLAAVYLDEENYDEALRYAKTALYIDVLDVDVHRLLAEAYRGKKEWDRAIEEYEVAEDLNPGEADLTLGLAITQVEAGRKPAAEKTLKRLLKEHPNHKEAQQLLERL